jgi:hypothetical protein
MRKGFLAVMVAAMLLGFSLSVPLGVWIVVHTSPAYAAPPTADTCSGGLTEIADADNATGLDVNGDGLICAKDNQPPKKT